MKTFGKTNWPSLFLIGTLFLNGIIPAQAQSGQKILIDFSEQTDTEFDRGERFNEILQAARGGEFSALIERIFGGETDAALAEFDEDSGQLFRAVTEGASQKAEESLEKQITERADKSGAKNVVAPEVKADPAKKPVRKTRSKKIGFNVRPKFDWRQFAFGFQPLPVQDEKPDIKFTETDKELKAEGANKKSFETKEAKGTRTQKAETRYIKNGESFGVEIKHTEVIDAVSKADGKSFRKEISMVWGAEVAACPDVNGISAGTGGAKVTAQTVYTENGSAITMTSEFDLQAKLTGHVNDQAELTHYDLELDAYTTNSGYEDALRRNIIKEIKIKDGKYGLHYDIPGNKIEVSDGKYGGDRTPAKIGKATARLLTPMSDADATLVGKALGPMVPSIWNSANEMYGAAQKNWRKSGCVEVVLKVPKTKLKEGEEIVISAESVHLKDNGKINAQLNAEAYPGVLTPESQAARPQANFTFTKEGEETSYFSVESVSKRGIGKGDIDFQPEKEDEEPAGVWTGTISAERTQREEREKRSGANLAENGGYMETNTNVRLQLTGRLDRTVDATNAYIANVTGEQQFIDYEYDKYKVDEGYCGPNAVPYKGPKEITRTSTTTVDYSSETRVYVEIGTTGGTLTFSLPETNGTTVHKYEHKSPCAEHDRANTSEAIDEEAATVGGSFSVSFPIDPNKREISGTFTVRDDDGSVTVYTYQLSRRPN